MMELMDNELEIILGWYRGVRSEAQNYEYDDELYKKINGR